MTAAGGSDKVKGCCNTAGGGLDVNTPADLWTLPPEPSVLSLDLKGTMQIIVLDDTRSSECHFTIQFVL